MSIYPVKVSTWWNDEPQEKEILKEEIKTLNIPCDVCGRRITWRGAWASHSIMYGYGSWYCSVKCAYPSQTYTSRNKKEPPINYEI